MVSAQKWLEENYSNKEETVIEYDKNKEAKLEGELVIADFPKLKTISLINGKELTELVIKNCPNVETLFCQDNPLLRTVVGIEKLSKLSFLNSSGSFPLIELLKKVGNSESDQNLRSQVVASEAGESEHQMGSEKEEDDLMVDIEECKESTIKYLNNELKKNYLTFESLCDENKNYETEIQNKDDLKEIREIKARVIENLLKEVGDENSEFERILTKFKKESFTEIGYYFLDITNSHKVFYSSVEKVIKYIELNSEFMSKLVDEELNFDSNSPIEIAKGEWDVTKKFFKPFSNLPSESSKSASDVRTFLRESNRDYEKGIDSAANVKEMKVIFENVLNDRLLRRFLEGFVIWFGEESLEFLKKGSSPFFDRGSPELLDFLKRVSATHEGELKDELVKIIENFEKKFENIHNHNIVDIIDFLNKEVTLSSIELIKKLMSYRRIISTHFKYLEDLGDDFRNNSFAKELEGDWWWCTDKDCWNRSTSEINYSLWEKHLQHHNILFVKSLFDTARLIEVLDWIDEHRDELLESAKRKITKEVKEKKLIIDDLEETLKRITTMKQIDNFREWNKLEEKTKSKKVDIDKDQLQVAQQEIPPKMPE